MPSFPSRIPNPACARSDTPAVPVAYPRPPVTRACCALVPARRSYPSATRARSLFLLVCYSYSPRYSLLLWLATPSWRSTSTPATPTWRTTSTPGHGHYPGCEHPRARALPGVRPWATPVLLVLLPVHVLGLSIRRGRECARATYARVAVASAASARRGCRPARGVASLLGEGHTLL